MFYINGFTVAVSNSDIILTTQIQGTQNLSLTIPYGVARALGGALTQSVDFVEKAVGVKYPPPDEVEKLLKKLQAEQQKK